jgi:ATP-dependent DNA helicase RecG
VSEIAKPPASRKPIVTSWITEERAGEAYERLTRLLREGRQAYVVCPLIETSETSNARAAEAEAERLRGAELRDFRVGCLHGRVKPAERRELMARFNARDLDVLVATTVIEVGVDVPAATVMIIEHAERFGLAQLHQLRGRVGRGTGQSSCLLLYAMPLGETAKARLAIMRETEDGFRIAEEDLKLRGAGELLGTRQSGLPDMHLADLATHAELLQAARDDAHLIVDRDPDLESERGEALKALLYLFRRDDAVRTLRAG